MMTMPDINELIADLNGAAVPVRLGEAAVAPAQAADASGCACR